MPTAATVAESLRQAQTQGLARVDAQILLLHSLQRPLHDRAWLLAHDGDTLTAAQTATWQDALQRRLQGEPVAYITGRKDFFGLTLAVDARVLDPRPDTETLVEWALACLPESAPETRSPRILDLGTGSGAVALALQHARPDAKVWAVDASEDALAVARANAARLHLGVQFMASDWLCAVDVQRTGRFDLIVSNPPYVAENDPHLAALTHEPLSALTSGADGLEDIRRIIAQAPAYLARGGWLLLEHGWDQSAAVQSLLQAAGFAQVQSRQDLAGIQRCTGGCWHSEG
ncbi:peptide chain release factor N(5)-glutamine methyltransferase [Limnohabitans sp. Hippo3]|uniref:peptide chain release factor N(5)-glutamine methyltransferase n=1 Tax=Limnohabitans sp. Hippo3 TaxID=1597956 RepID=UPI000D360B39|nr:peptide chain release factor N(5)-glutamine methyltransferase [Limnohabitans sp. Hippo3]PUE39968.1 protein-(glutamine-N5) methyltransferase, release factor-specific [Limnohabitans sp. Hippo3]